MKPDVFWWFLKLAERTQQKHFIGSCLFWWQSVKTHIDSSILTSLRHFLPKCWHLHFISIGYYVAKPLCCIKNGVFSSISLLWKIQFHNLLKCKINFPSFRTFTYLVFSLENSQDATFDSTCLLTWARGHVWPLQDQGSWSLSMFRWLDNLEWLKWREISTKCLTFTAFSKAKEFSLQILF